MTVKLDNPDQIDLNKSVAEIFSEHYKSELERNGITPYEDMPSGEQKKIDDIEEFSQERLKTWDETTAALSGYIPDWIATIRKDVKDQRYGTINEIINTLTEDYIKAIIAPISPKATATLEVVDQVQSTLQWVKQEIIEFLIHLEDKVYNTVTDELFLKNNIGTATFNDDTVQLSELIITEGEKFFKQEIDRIRSKLKNKGCKFEEEVSKISDYFISAVLFLFQDEIEELKKSLAGRRI